VGASGRKVTGETEQVKAMWLPLGNFRLFAYVQSMFQTTGGAGVSIFEGRAERPSDIRVPNLCMVDPARLSTMT